ncbi:uncharacterized protein LOC142351011 isoform X2 [Convolutriloba macropyga]|uniref:uncharacterized protein LOC142351011 isoform X2 n=1 Tax=Convolutriloba macropyga TaxID=536237 RepID=UPI003F51B406
MAVLYSRSIASGFNSPLCLASFIDRCTVITTASCFQGIQPATKLYGSLEFRPVHSGEESEFRVKQLRVHGQYNEATRQNNIALAMFECEADEYQSEVATGKVQLPSGEHIEERADLFGWRRVEYMKQLSSQLVFSEATIKNRLDRSQRGLISE